MEAALGQPENQMNSTRVAADVPGSQHVEFAAGSWPPCGRMSDGSQAHLERADGEVEIANADTIARSVPAGHAIPAESPLCGLCRVTLARLGLFPVVVEMREDVCDAPGLPRKGAVRVDCPFPCRGEFCPGFREAPLPEQHATEFQLARVSVTTFGA